MGYSKPVVNVVWNEVGYSDVLGFHFVSRQYIVASPYFRVIIYRERMEKGTKKLNGIVCYCSFWDLDGLPVVPIF